MNSAPNSDCKQCTGSKLGWVHSVHPQGTQAASALRPGRSHSAVSWCTGCHIVAPGRRVMAVSQRSLVVSRAVSRALSSPPGHDKKIVSQLKSLACALSCLSQHSCAVSQGGLRCIAALLHHIATPKVAPCHDTKIVS